MASETGRELMNPAYDRIANIGEFIKQMGRSIALSKMFGCETEAQGEVMALECISRRMPPMMIAERYHLIKGKLSLKAEAMLADFRSRVGGDYRIIERSSERAAIELTLRGERLLGELLWSEVQQEPFVYSGKEDEIVDALAAGKREKLRLKPKYATPRSRMQMLWARVVSDTVRAMAPEVTAGRYTPEEVGDFGDGDGDGDGDGIDHAVPHDRNGSSVIESEVVLPATAAASPAGPTTPTTSRTPHYATPEQVNEIVDLLLKVGATHEQQEAIKSKRGVKAWPSLTDEQACELIDALTAKLDRSKLDDAATRARDDSPCSQAQIDRAKALIAEIAENGDSKIASTVASKIKAAGLQRLSDLTQSECEGLIHALGAKNLDVFFATPPAGHAARKAAAEQAAGN